jgi:hypothetical protein
MLARRCATQRNRPPTQRRRPSKGDNAKGGKDRQNNGKWAFRTAYTVLDASRMIEWSRVWLTWGLVVAEFEEAADAQFLGAGRRHRDGRHPTGVGVTDVPGRGGPGRRLNPNQTTTRAGSPALSFGDQPARLLMRDRPISGRRWAPRSSLLYAPPLRDSCRCQLRHR